MDRWIPAAAALGLLLAACGGRAEPALVTAPPAAPSSASSAAAAPAPALPDAVEAPETVPPADPTEAVSPPPDPSDPSPPPNAGAGGGAGPNREQGADREADPDGAPADAPEPDAAPPPDSPPEQTEAPAPSEALPPLQSLVYRTVAEVDFPIDLAPLPGSGLLVIASKEGRLWLHDGGELRSEPFLDIRDRVRNRGEQGLLGMAFSPDYPETGRLFLHYTALDGDTVLAEYTADGGSADPAAEAVLWRVGQPAGNHNGGTIAFGPDGYLYMGLGDGGGAGDRFGHGQNGQTPLGALLRFDVSAPGALSPAPGNPFPAPEVWAVGLRNPWRFTIDFPSGLIVIADVGQDLFEEVSIAPADAPGLNYGWPVTEGRHCFRPASGCDAAGLTLPVLEVEHGDAGTCSITGGVVYRGAEIPELYGHYLFSDYCGGYLRSFPVDAFAGAAPPYAPLAEPPLDWTGQAGVPGQVASFGVDAAGEVYVLVSEGRVLRLEALRG